MHPTQLFIGELRPLPQSGRPSGIFKTPVCAPVSIAETGFAGDQQADLRVHGGPEKAVHLYPADHYPRLAAAFPEVAAQLVPGSLGENISVAGLDEHAVRIGETFALGSAVLQLCQPRNPCWKIDERFGVDGMAALIAREQLTGWYFRVCQPGLADNGTPLRSLGAPPQAPTLYAAMHSWQAHRPDPAQLEQLAATPGIARHWQAKIEQRLAWLRAYPAALPTPVASFHPRPATD
ncbi:MOSC domain-containing protein [Dechloromonas sp. ZY10]|uniref:MOSC domain-containing protein n=1 Tax=Dechloromonas aquae TaxID=2664436 RepID=UPI003526CA7B